MKSKNWAAFLEGKIPLYFIAEIGANHDGSLERAEKLIMLAAQSGAHAVKFQHFLAPKIVSKSGFEALGAQLSHQKSWEKPVYEVYAENSINRSWTSDLVKISEACGVDFFTSPYDRDAVRECSAYMDLMKIGSGDISWPEILRAITEEDKSILLATGASTISEVEAAVQVISKSSRRYVIMQCNTDYTGSDKVYDSINLNVLQTYSRRFPEAILGLSDHTPSNATVLASVVLGARVFEKHFTDDKSRNGPDHAFAITPSEWRDMVDRAFEVYEALGDGIKRVEKNEFSARIVQRRALRALQEIPLGTIFESNDFEALRPCPEHALSPLEAEQFLGRYIMKPLQKGDLLTKDHFND